jgi:hypothetical protein
MNKLLQPVFRVGCLASLVVAPIVAIVVYPRANWLFAFLFLGIALFAFGIITRKQPTPAELADLAQRLLDGSYDRWDVDDYEHLNPKSKHLNGLWRMSMDIGGLPEEWIKLDDVKKDKLRLIIRDMRGLGSGGS